MTLRKVLAKNIKRIRCQYGLSQEDLSNKCGLHRTYISSIENEKRNISIDNLEKIACALKVSPKDLLRKDK